MYIYTETTILYKDFKIENWNEKWKFCKFILKLNVLNPFAMQWKPIRHNNKEFKDYRRSNR